ncbi:MAG: DUF1493 family protein [Saprospiraceae bacterium]
MNNFFDEILDFVYQERGKYKGELTRNTELEHDLGITGDDAHEFMEAFFKKFQIKEKAFDLNKYFEPEGFSLINLKWLFGKRTAKEIRKPIRLGHLEKVAESGYWVDPTD